VEREEEEKIMSTIFSIRRVFRGALCAAVAVAITSVGWYGFQVSTAHAPGDRAVVESVASTKIPVAHSVFGRPEPAVLVD
jgi:hypothetical protein